jgi:hypothetical protein
MSFKPKTPLLTLYNEKGDRARRLSGLFFPCAQAGHIGLSYFFI